MSYDVSIASPRELRNDPHDSTFLSYVENANGSVRLTAALRLPTARAIWLEPSHACGGRHHTADVRRSFGNKATWDTPFVVHVVPVIWPTWPLVLWSQVYAVEGESKVQWRTRASSVWSGASTAVSA